MGGSLDTVTKIENLLRFEMKASHFVALAQAYGVPSVDAVWVSRLLNRKINMSARTEQMLRPLVSRIEDLAARALPFPVGWDATDRVKNLLDAIQDDGLNVETKARMTFNWDNEQEAAAISPR